MANTTISCWENDPGSGPQPDGGPLIQIPTPDLSATTLPTFIENPSTSPPPKVYNTGTPEFRYWAAAAALARGSQFWSTQLPGVSWEVGDKLPANLDDGEDLNAYYDRVGLRFFHGVVGDRTYYSGESPDIVCHEQGHAVLDSIKPELWDAASIEIAAFHEGFADIAALLCGLQVPSLRQGVLNETNGQLYHSSRLSRLAEQLGYAIRQVSPASAETDCLRNAVNNFFYQDPNTLPTNAPASMLCSEPHSFSRVISGAVFEGLANMFGTQSAQDEMHLLQTSLDLAQILIAAIRAAPVVPSFYSQVGINMINIANTNFPATTYSMALRSAFVRHGILSPATAVTFPAVPMAAAAAPSPQSAAAAVTPSSQSAAAPARPSSPLSTIAAVVKELPQLRLAVSEYGWGLETVLVHAASQAKHFDAAGASLSIGNAAPTPHDVAAKAFLEDLVRRGRLKIPDAPATGPAKMGMAITAPGRTKKHETFTHELRRVNGDLVLKRTCVDCCFH